MNHGLTPDELVEVVKLPPHLASFRPWMLEFNCGDQGGLRYLIDGLASLIL